MVAARRGPGVRDAANADSYNRTMPAALILFAHGARDPQWSVPFQRILERVRRDAPDREVTLAYLEFMQPDLAVAVREQVARGQRAIAIVPLFLGPGGHLRHQLPLLVDRARAEHPQVTIEIRAPAGDDDQVIAALAAYAMR